MLSNLCSGTFAALLTCSLILVIAQTRRLNETFACGTLVILKEDLKSFNLYFYLLAILCKKERKKLKWETKQARKAATMVGKRSAKYNTNLIICKVV